MVGSVVSNVAGPARGVCIYLNASRAGRVKASRGCYGPMS